MSGDENQGSDQNSQVDPARMAWVKQEVDDVDAWAVIKFAIGLLIIGIVAYGTLYGLLRVFERERLAAKGPPPLMPRGAEERLPPPPRLQMMPGSPSALKTPDYEMEAMLEEEDKTLKSYGWVDKNSGVARIPIDEAMKLVIEKGLPSRPSPAGQAATESSAGAKTDEREKR